MLLIGYAVISILCIFGFSIMAARTDVFGWESWSRTNKVVLASLFWPVFIVAAFLAFILALISIFIEKLEKQNENG